MHKKTRMLHEILGDLLPLAIDFEIRDQRTSPNQKLPTDFSQATCLTWPFNDILSNPPGVLFGEPCHPRNQKLQQHFLDPIESNLDRAQDQDLAPLSSL